MFARPGESSSRAVEFQLPSDATDDVRTTLAQLTARARRLIGDNDNNLVSLNSRGVYEVSRRTADAIRQQTEGIGAGSAPSSQASVELFMARNLGFDLQEQQRLIQQLQRHQAEMAVDASSAAAVDPRIALSVRSPYRSMDSAGDIDAVVEGMKQSLIHQAHHTIYQKEQMDIQERRHELLKAAWKSFYLGVSDDFDGLSASMEHTMHTKGAAAPRTHHQSSPSSSQNGGKTDFPRPSEFLDFLSSDAPLSLEINKAIAAFALIVEQYTPSEWISCFTSYAVEQNSCSGTDMGVLWATLQAILQPLIRQGSSATMLSYVACSREVIEKKARNRLMTSGVRIDPARVEELENMPADRVYELIQSRVGGNPWCHAYTAMKAGRYDVAVLAARRIGSAAVEEALRRWADASPMERQRLQPLPSLHALYAEDATQDDAYRKAVLFALLVGRTGEAENIIEQTLLQLTSKVSSSLEDMLWLRLVCIRTQEETAVGGKVQSLVYMQKAILDDLQDLVQVVQGSVPRLASFLFHAVLPATGIRLLLENPASYVDGVHMALCFSTCNLLHDSAIESPVDLERHICRYCALVLLREAGSAVSKDRAQASASTFSYFQKTGFTQAFVEFCQKDLVCAKLFGLRTENGTGVLLQRSRGDQTELWKAMQLVAETAASRNSFAMALHMLISVTQSVIRCGGPRKTALASLCRAVQIACPALSQMFYLPIQSSDAGAVISEATHVLHLLQQQQLSVLDGLSEVEYETLSTLCVMSDVYLAAGNNQWEAVLSAFFRLPFVPQSTNTDVEASVQKYCCSSPHVVAAGGAILPLAFRAATHVLDHYHQLRNANSFHGADALSKSVALRQQMQVVALWLRRLCAQPGQTFSELPQEVYDFEQRFLGV